MSGFELKEGQGSLHINDKGDNPARPDRRGEILINGVIYELSGWIKPGRQDPHKQWLSLSAKPKEQRQAQGQPAPRRATAPQRGGFDDGPPF